MISQTCKSICRKPTFYWLGPKLPYIPQIIIRIGRQTPRVNSSDYFVFDNLSLSLGDFINNICQAICAWNRTFSGAIKVGGNFGLLCTNSDCPFSSTWGDTAKYTKHQVLNRDHGVKSNKDLTERRIFPPRYEDNIEYLHKQYNQF